MIRTEGLAKEVIREVIRERHVGVMPILLTEIHQHHSFEKIPPKISVSFTTTEIPEPTLRTSAESIGVSFTTTEIPEPTLRTSAESIGVSFTTTIT